MSNNEHDKRVWAEVLAECLARLGDLVVSRQDAATQAGRDGKESLRLMFVDERDGIKAAILALKSLQPADEALEELLRQARKLGWDSGVVVGKLEEHIAQHIHDDPRCIRDPCTWRTKSEARLEQARANLEKP